MKVDISKAQTRTAVGESITAIESSGGRLLLHFEGNGYSPFCSLKEITHVVGIESQSLRGAVEAEGYEIDGHEIRLIRLPGMDDQGAIQAKNMEAEYLDRVRDWQWIQEGYSSWEDFTGGRQGSYGFSGVALWPLWRPKSYAMVETQECDKCDGYSHPTDACDTEGEGPLGFPFTANQDNPIKGSSVDWSAGYDVPRAELFPETIERVERTSEGRITAHGDTNPETMRQGDREETVEPTPIVTLEEKQKIFEASCQKPEGEVPDIHTWTVERALKIQQGCARGQIEWLKLQALRQVAKAFRFAQSYGLREETVMAFEPAPNPFERIALDLAALVADKQRQYGDSAGRTGAILRVLYPDGVPPDAYDRAILVVRVLDKLSRLATNKVDLGGESPWRDIAGYALLAIEKGF